MKDEVKEILPMKDAFVFKDRKSYGVKVRIFYESEVGGNQFCIFKRYEVM